MQREIFVTHWINRRDFVTNTDTCWINIYGEQRWRWCYIIWSRGTVAKFWNSDLRSGLGLVSMCVENVLVGGRNLNKFKSGDVNDKCYTTVSLLRAGGATTGSILERRIIKSVKHSQCLKGSIRDFVNQSSQHKCYCGESDAPRQSVVTIITSHSHPSWCCDISLWSLMSHRSW